MRRKPDSPADAPATPHLAANTAPAEAGPARSVPLPETADALAADDASHMPGTLDAHGFDPAEFKWVPVRRKPRLDGWSPERQRLFIEVLADTGCVT